MNEARLIALSVSIIVLIILGLFSILRIEETRSSVVRLEPEITALSVALDELKNQQSETLAEVKRQRGELDNIADTTTKSLAENQQAIETLTSLLNSQGQDPIPEWKRETTVEEGKRLFATCLSERAGLLGELMASSLDEPNELWDSLNTDSGLDELTGVKLMGTMFGCWK